MQICLLVLSFIVSIIIVSNNGDYGSGDGRVDGRRSVTMVMN